MDNFASKDKSWELWVLLAQTRSVLYRVRQKELKQYNVSTEQSAVLFIIQAIGKKATPAEIARWLMRERNSVSSILGRMEKDGLVKKT